MAGRIPRRLAGILCSDIAGYSRLTGEDEDANHSTSNNYLDPISTVITSYHGRKILYTVSAVQKD